MKKIIIIFLLLVSTTKLFSQNLYDLIANNEYEKVKEYSKPLNVYNLDQTTPLMWAIYKSDLKMVELLVSKGADPKMKSWLSIEPYLAGSNLVLAAWMGKTDILGYLLKNKYFKIDDPEYGFNNRDLRDGWNALHTAAYKGNLNVVKYLVKEGANINALTETNENKTPLLMALYYGKLDVATELINLGADVNIRDQFYTSSLELALSLENKKLVKLIYDKGFKFTENRKDVYLTRLKEIFNVESFEQLTE